jgi:hypothetical protein
MNLFNELRSLAKLRQYDLANSVVPAHNFVSDALMPPPGVAVPVKANFKRK